VSAKSFADLARSGVVVTAGWVCGLELDSTLRSNVRVHGWDDCMRHLRGVRADARGGGLQFYGNTTPHRQSRGGQSWRGHTDCILQLHHCFGGGLPNRGHRHRLPLVALFSHNFPLIASLAKPGAPQYIPAPALADGVKVAQVTLTHLV
jgi:hypothetical protein